MIPVGVSKENLSELADALVNFDDGATGRLGLNLGVWQWKVNQYLKNNTDHGDGSGTLAMLLRWRKKTHTSKQVPRLVKAILKSVDRSFISKLGS